MSVASRSSSHCAKRSVSMLRRSHSASDEVLLPLANRRGGMRPETRVFRWREIARITQTQFSGDLDSILAMPYTKAKKALKQFPTIGDPGAEKILFFCGVASGLPLESNGLRVLVRIGWGRLQKSYRSHLPLCSGRSETQPSRHRKHTQRSASSAAPARKNSLQGKGSPVRPMPALQRMRLRCEACWFYLPPLLSATWQHGTSPIP